MTAGFRTHPSGFRTPPSQPCQPKSGLNFPKKNGRLDWKGLSSPFPLWWFCLDVALLASEAASLYNINTFVIGQRTALQAWGWQRLSPKTPMPSFPWLVVSTHLKNISEIGNLPQVGVKIKNLWNHHLFPNKKMFQTSAPATWFPSAELVKPHHLSFEQKCPCNTVDGRNRAPPGMYKNRVNNAIFTISAG